ncbi:DNA-binding protein [Nocardiopsis sp. NPDC055551]|uniref:DNA-binding protein n=1 Tax=Nocardiopsis sp. NPDC006832 TaxID=3157188 RepID=UPI0033F9076B
MTSPRTPHPEWARALHRARVEAGWDVHRLAVEMVRAARTEATATTESLARRIREWEAGRNAIRERYRPLLARVFHLGPEIFAERPVGGTDTTRVRSVTKGLIALDELTGGTDLLPMAVRNARSSHQAALVGDDKEMASAAAEALQVAGWLAFDADDHLLARRLTSASVLTSRAGGDRFAELFALAQLAMQDAHEYRPDQARTVCEHVLKQDVSPRIRGLFELRLARAQGQEGTPVRARETLNRARARLRGEDRDRDPPWTWWITDAELSWHEAMIHVDNEDWGAAVELFESALGGRPPGYERGVLNDAAHLAHALTRVGAWPDAEQVLRVAVVPAVGRVRSGRAHALLLRTGAEVSADSGPLALRELLAQATT